MPSNALSITRIFMREQQMLSMYICGKLVLVCSNQNIVFSFRSLHRCHGFTLMYLYSFSLLRIWSSVQTSLQTYSWNSAVGILLISVHFSSYMDSGMLTQPLCISSIKTALHWQEPRLNQRQPLMLTMIGACRFNICHFLKMLLLGAFLWEEETQNKSIQFGCAVTVV